VKYLFLIFLLSTKIISNDTITDSTFTKPDAHEYHFIWEEPKVTDGCWKIGKDKSITKAPDISKEDCKKLEKAAEWVKLYEVSYKLSSRSY